MKKLLMLALMLSSTSALASSPLIKNDNSALAEISYTDNEVSAENKFTMKGFRINYERQLDTEKEFGVHFQHDHMTEDGFDFDLSLLGFTYKLPLATDLFSVHPEIGVSRLVEKYNFDGFSGKNTENKLYFGVNANAELIDDSLYAKVYLRSYDDSIVDDELLGVKLSYSVNENVSLHVAYDDWGDVETVSAGFGYSF